MILTVTLNAAIDKRYVVETFHPGEVNRVKECEYVPGGKGLNVSKPLAIAGAQVKATGFVGGHAGDYICERLKDYGVEDAFYHVKAESRSCINIWDETARQQTEFLEPGFTIGEADWQGFVEHFKALAAEAEVIAMSGSVPKGLDYHAYQELIGIGKSLGKKVILDTSGKLLEEGVKAVPYMIKPNIDEIRMLTGHAINTDTEDFVPELVEAANKLRATGIEIVTVSLGADGSLMVCGDGVFRAIVPRIDAVNTVGCGDSMIAGFALGLSEGLTPVDILRKASAISAASAMTEETGRFVLEDMASLMDRIEIKRL